MKASKTTEPKELLNQSIDFYKIFRVFWSRWYWIAATIVIAMAVAKVQLWYATPIYQTSASLKLQESNPSLGSASAPMSSQVYNYTDKIQAESFVIRSNDVVLKAIGNLDYKISYFLKGRFRTSDVYPDKPIKIEILKQDSVNFDRGVYNVEPIDQQNFKISNPENPKKPSNIHRYGEILQMGNMAFRVLSKLPSNGDYSFKFNSKEDFIGRAMSVNVMEAARFTNVMALSQTDANPQFAADILNAIMKEYISYDVIQRRRSARQTIEFIDTQLGYISTEAGKSGTNLANYQAQNKIVDMSSSSGIVINRLTDFEKQKADLNIQQLSIKLLEDQVNSSKSKIEINLDLEGVLNNTVAPLVADLNKLVLSREDKLRQFIPTSQPIKDLDRQIAIAKSDIRTNIGLLRIRNEKTIDFINSQIAGVNQSIVGLPVKQQNIVKLQSNFDVNNKVRSYLSEKKLEAEMNAAAIVPGAAIVNQAYPSYYAISPTSDKVYMTAFLIGFGAGIGLILLVRFLNPYIYDKETVEALTNTPIIGVIRKFPDHIDKDSKQALSLSKPKSVFAESVRSVRTNLSFLASNKQSKTICITSEVSGEGKSFVTINLASTLALIDKKIILIAADLRKSKLHTVFGGNNKIGLSSILSGQKTFEEALISDKTHGIDFIASGPVPPNPSELLHTKAMKDLLAKLVPLYDYVLIDTAPVGLVSDAIPLIRESDVNLFVIRSGVSAQRAAAIPERLSREYGLSNMAIVLNAFGDDALYANYYTTDYARSGGNSTYYYSDYSGYSGSGYYEDENIRWWQFWKKKG